MPSVRVLREFHRCTGCTSSWPYKWKFFHVLGQTDPLARLELFVEIVRITICPVHHRPPSYQAVSTKGSSQTASVCARAAPLLTLSQVDALIYSSFMHLFLIYINYLVRTLDGWNISSKTCTCFSWEFQQKQKNLGRTFFVNHCDVWNDGTWILQKSENNVQHLKLSLA